MKRAVLKIILLVNIVSLLADVRDLDAATLPHYTVSSDDMSLPAEAVLRKYSAILEGFHAEIRAAKVNRGRYNLSQAQEMRLYRLPAFQEAKTAVQFWNYAVGLKHALLALSEAPANKVQSEADLLAKKTIAAFYVLADRYRVIGPPLVHNLAIKLRIRDRGYCYHYVSDLWRLLQSVPLSAFTLRWAGAHTGNWMETNALAIVPAGKPFGAGLVIDGWRDSGRPYWHTIAGDRWKWTEVVDYYLTP